ncbi:tRNA lysidine(34) synthetase TilS [Leucobacter sp. 1207-22]|uniref:tRNA lysidine(34) synthetase TilS n=1 Tax=Leucobacter sp. 1207-22 TaxID=2604456 RepID=UPI0040646C77
MPQLVHSPAGMRIRAAIRPALQARTGETILVGLSGGADSLALLVACAEEASSAAFRGSGVRIRAAVIDHGLQPGSAAIAEHAAAQAREYGVEVDVRAVEVPGGTGVGGMEAAARSARYAALAKIADEHGAGTVLTAHTRDDQAEQVLLALARGSGTRAIAGIPLERELAPGVRIVRPLLAESAEITRADTIASCVDHGLTPWHDPHNVDTAFARVRARRVVLPVCETELGPGVSAALARTADIAREDADTLDALAAEAMESVLQVAGSATHSNADPRALSVAALADLLPAVRHRVIRRFATTQCAASMTREQTLQVAALVTDWRGQGAVNASGVTVRRVRGDLLFEAHA